MTTSLDRCARLRVLALACTTAALAALSACGDGGDSPSPGAPGAPSPGAPSPAPGPAPTYSVGGSITGLATDGLALTDGLSTMQVAADAASFTFPESFAQGSSYAVTVVMQPSSRAQTCSVADGSGTVADADVTSIGIDCHATQWAYAPVAGGVVEGGLNYHYVDGAAAAATFNTPSELVYGQDGTLYLADSGDGAIRSIAPDGTVSTLAGGIGRGGDDGVGTAATFDFPVGLTLGPDGNLYVADTTSIRKVGLDGTVTTIAGRPLESGNAVGASFDARFTDARSLRFDAQGTTLYILDGANGNADVRKLVDGVVSVVAGGPSSEQLDGHGTAATFSGPFVMDIDRDGNLLVGDQASLRKVTPAGDVTTVIAADPATFCPAGVWPVTVPICGITGLLADPSGYVYIVDGTGARVLAYSPDGLLSTPYQASLPDGSDPRNAFAPYGLAMDSDGSFVMSNYDATVPLDKDGPVRLTPQ